jgi:hypothetical protein
MRHIMTSRSGEHPPEQPEDRLDIRPTGTGTAATNDVADPHASDEEHPYREHRPGGASPDSDIDRVNDKVNDGSAPPRPDNAETSR